MNEYYTYTVWCRDDKNSLSSVASCLSSEEAQFKRLHLQDINPRSFFFITREKDQE